MYGWQACGWHPTWMLSCISLAAEEQLTISIWFNCSHADLAWFSVTMRMINYTELYTVEMDTDEMDTDITVPNIEATESSTFDVMMILQMLIASVGIIANFTAVFAFLNHKQLRRKIPNLFIINQVNYWSAMPLNLVWYLLVAHGVTLVVAFYSLSPTLGRRRGTSRCILSFHDWRLSSWKIQRCRNTQHLPAVIQIL